MAVQIAVVGKYDGKELEKAKRELAKLGDATEKQGGRISRGLGSAAKAAAKLAAATVAAGAVAGAALLGAAGTIDDAYDTIRVGTGATGDTLQGLKDDFAAVAKTTPVAMGQVGTAIADVNTRLGLTGEVLQDRSRQFLELSRITKTDLATNISQVSRLFGDFAVATDAQAGSMDALFRVSQASGIAVDRLSAQMVQFGAPLRQLGFDFSESAALIAKFEKEGVNAEAVLGGMKQSLGRMAKAGEEPIETFARLSEEIANATSTGEANAIAVETFGTRAGPDLAAAIREGRFELSDYMKVIDDGSETILGAAADTEDWRDKLAKLKNRVLIKLAPVAMKVFDAVGRAFDRIVPRVEELVDRWGPPLTAFIRDVLTRISDWWSANGPTIIRLAREIAGAVATGFEALVAAGAFVVRNWDTIKTVLLAAGAVIVTVMLPHWISLGVQATVSAAKNAAAWVVTEVAAIKAGVVHSGQVVKMVAKWVVLGAKSLVHAARVAAAWLISMGPIPIVIAAVVGLVVAIVKNWETIKRVIVGAAKAVLGWIKKHWPLILALVTGPIGLAVLAIVKHWDTIMAAVTAVRDWIVDRFNDVVGFLKGIPGAISGALSGMWGFATEQATAAKDWIVARLEDVVGFVAGLPGRIGQAATGMWDGIRDAFRTAINWIVDKWNSFQIVVGGWNIPAPGPIPGSITVPRVTVPMPNIPRLAQGAIALATPGGTLANIGEGTNDEAILPLPPGWRRNGIGGPTIVLQVDVDARGADASAVAQIRQAARDAAEEIVAAVVGELASGAGAA